MSTQDRPPTENQGSQDLPGPKVFITTHNESSGEAVVHSTNPVKWVKYDEDRLMMSVAYTTQFPADLNDEADIKKHDDRMAQGPGATGLALGGGTVLRFVDFAPGYTCMMHRTQSLDYGIVLEGQIEQVLDSGEVTLMGRGDVMVQRATMHQWRNPSKTEWARMIFSLQDCKPLHVAGKRMKEDGIGELPKSGNDD